MKNIVMALFVTFVGYKKFTLEHLRSFSKKKRKTGSMETAVR